MKSVFHFPICFALVFRSGPSLLHTSSLYSQPNHGSSDWMVPLSGWENELMKIGGQDIVQYESRRSSSDNRDGSHSQVYNCLETSLLQYSSLISCESNHHGNGYIMYAIWYVIYINFLISVFYGLLYYR